MIRTTIPKVGTVVEFGGRIGKVVGHSVIEARNGTAQQVVIVRTAPDAGGYLETGPRTFVSTFVVDLHALDSVDGEAVPEDDGDDEPFTD